MEIKKSAHARERESERRGEGERRREKLREKRVVQNGEKRKNIIGREKKWVDVKLK